MGWASGSSLFSEIIEAAKEAIPDPAIRKEFYWKTIVSFENFDCDTLSECALAEEDDAFTWAYTELNPGWNEEMEE